VIRKGRAGSTPAQGTIKAVWPLFFMHFVYILYSEKCDRFYVGFSADVTARLNRHNAGLVKATRNCRPYLLAASKEFPTEKEARAEEIKIKRQKSRTYLLNLIRGNW
jgi:putative endonuclease